MNTRSSSQTADKVICSRPQTSYLVSHINLKLVKGYGASGVFLNRNRDGSGKYPVIHKGAVRPLRLHPGSSPQGSGSYRQLGLKLQFLQPEAGRPSGAGVRLRESRACSGGQANRTALGQDWAGAKTSLKGHTDYNCPPLSLPSPGRLWPPDTRSCSDELVQKKKQARS